MSDEAELRALWTPDPVLAEQLAIMFPKGLAWAHDRPMRACAALTRYFWGQFAMEAHCLYIFQEVRVFGFNFKPSLNSDDCILHCAKALFAYFRDLYFFKQQQICIASLNNWI